MKHEGSSVTVAPKAGTARGTIKVSSRDRRDIDLLTELVREWGFDDEEMRQGVRDLIEASQARKTIVGVKNMAARRKE